MFKNYNEISAILIEIQADKLCETANMTFVSDFVMPLRGAMQDVNSGLTPDSAKLYLDESMLSLQKSIDTAIKHNWNANKIDAAISAHIELATRVQAIKNLL